MRTILSAVVCVGVALVLSLPAQAGAPARAPAPPPGVVAPEKDEGVLKTSIGGEIYSFYDYRRNLNTFNSSSSNHDRTDWTVSRVRLDFDFQLSEGVSAFVQPQAFYTWGGMSGRNQPGTDPYNDHVTDGDHVEMYQANVTFKGELFEKLQSDVKVGRQELVFDEGETAPGHKTRLSQMIMGNDSNNGGLSFDAVRADLKLLPQWTATVFAAKLVENDAATVNGQIQQTRLGTPMVGFGPYGVIDPHADVNLYGLWNTIALKDYDTRIDVYGLVLQSDLNVEATDALYQPGYTEGQLYTIGAAYRVDPIGMGPAGDCDFVAQVATQLGHLRAGATNDTIEVRDAYALEAEFGYRPALWMSPRVALGTALASGSDDPNSNKVQTFQPLFENTANRLGDADLVSLSNLKCWYAKAEFKPLNTSGYRNEKLTVGGAYYQFETMERNDAVGGNNFTQPANGVGPSDTPQDEVASEVDFFAEYAFSKKVNLRAAWAIVDPRDIVNHVPGMGNSTAQRLLLSLDVKW